MKTILFRRNNNSIYFNICILLILFFVIINGITSYSINKYFILTVITFFISLLKYDDLKKITYFLLPLTTIIHGYIILILLFLLLLKTKSLNKYQLIPSILLLSIETIHFFIFGNFIDFTDYMYYSSCIMIFFYLLFDNQNDNFKNISLFCYGSTIILFVVLFNMIATYGIAEVLTGIHRDGSTMGVNDDGNSVINVALNANSVGYLSIAIITLLFIGNKILRMPTYMYITMYIIAISAGIISFSRAWMIIMFFSLIIFILWNNVISKKILLIISLLILSIPFFSLEVIQNIYDTFYSRFISEDIVTGGNRVNISTKYIEYMNINIDSWIWGRGTINSKNINNVTIHNGTLQILFSYGIIGILIYLFSFLIYFNKNNLKNISKIQYIPFIACFMEIQTLQFLSPPFLMFPILVSLQAIKSKTNNYV